MKNNLRSIRKSMSLSQSQLSKKSGVPISSISILETRKKDILNFTVGTLYKLANSLHCTIDDFLFSNNSDSPDKIRYKFTESVISDNFKILNLEEYNHAKICNDFSNIIGVDVSLIEKDIIYQNKRCIYSHGKLEYRLFAILMDNKEYYVLLIYFYESSQNKKFCIINCYDFKTCRYDEYLSNEFGFDFQFIFDSKNKSTISQYLENIYIEAQMERERSDSEFDENLELLEEMYPEEIYE